MAQLSIRLDDELAGEVKAQAAALGRSVNGWVVDLLSAAVDPELEDTEARRTRARLERAGLLSTQRGRPRGAQPDKQTVSRARKAAGTGTPLSTLVSEGRR